MKKNMFILIILIFSFNVLGDHTLNFPNYFDVNVSEEIRLDNGGIIPGQSAFLFIGGITNQFNHINNNKSFQLYLTNDKEEDLNYLIYVYNTTTPFIQLNNSDGTLDGFLQIWDNRIYGFHVTTTENYTEGDLEQHTLCPYVIATKGTPILNSCATYRNLTTGKLIFDSTCQDTIVTNTASYDYVCMDDLQVYYDNLTSFEEYFMFTCKNCDGVNTKLRLGLDTTLPTNNSFILSDKIDQNITNITTSNFMFKVFSLEDEAFEIYNGIFKFRVPFYYTIHLFNQFNDSFVSEFDYVYLQKNILSSTNTLSQTGTDLSNTLNVFSNLISTPTIDYSEVFWGEVNVNSAVIKLYEAGNYSINLLSMKTFMPNYWIYEFIKPQYTKSIVETKLVKNIELTIETNSTINVAMSEFEANKKRYILNIVKWVFLIILLVGGLIIAFMSSSPIQVASAVLVIWLILVKGIGSINLL